MVSGSLFNFLWEGAVAIGSKLLLDYQRSKTWKFDQELWDAQKYYNDTPHVSNPPIRLPGLVKRESGDFNWLNSSQELAGQLSYLSEPVLRTDPGQMRLLVEKRSLAMVSKLQPDEPRNLTVNAITQSMLVENKGIGFYTQMVCQLPICNSSEPTEEDVNRHLKLNWKMVALLLASGVKLDLLEEEQ